MVLNHEKLKELEKSMGKKIEDLTEVERINLFESPSSYGLYDATPCDFLIVGVVLGVAGVLSNAILNKTPRSLRIFKKFKR